MEPQYDILLFGDESRKRSAFESSSNLSEDERLLRPQEVSLIHEHELCSTLHLNTAIRGKLEMKVDTFFGVRSQLVSMIRVWDAIMDQKFHYDETGDFNTDRDFMQSFLVGMHIITDRAKVGFLGPFSWRATYRGSDYEYELDSDDSDDAEFYPQGPLTPPDSNSDSYSEEEAPTTPYAPYEEDSIEVISITSGEGSIYSPPPSDDFMDADEGISFRDREGEGSSELESPLDLLFQMVGREDRGFGAAASAKKRGYEEFNSDQDQDQGHDSHRRKRKQ